MSEIFSMNPGVATAAFAAWIEVTGPDAEVFLQGQGTQDFRRMQSGEVRRSLWLSIKGKVLGEAVVLRGDRSWWLWSGHTPARTLVERLEAFIIADDVTIADVGAEWRHWTLVGREVVRAWGLGEPPAPGTWRSVPGGGLLFQGRRGLSGVWELLVPASASLPESFAGVPALCLEDLTRARVLAGEPAIPAEFGPNDLPQEAGLDRDSISFNKGCYLGQEVMARLHAMGQVRRRLVRVAGAGVPPPVGADLSQGGRRRGEVRVALAASPAGGDGWLGLAMLTLLGTESGAALFLPDGREVRIEVGAEGAS